MRQDGYTKAPSNVGGRPRSITSSMLDALRKRLLEKPDLYQEEMVHLRDEFNIEVSTQSVGRALRSIGWTKKKIRRIAKRQNADLRDFHLYNTKEFSPEQFVFIDESGTDKRGGFRRAGWSPLGVTAVQVAPFQREQR